MIAAALALLALGWGFGEFRRKLEIERQHQRILKRFDHLRKKRKRKRPGVWKTKQ